MKTPIVIAAACSLLASASAYAQTAAPMSFEEAAFVTCRDAQAMPAERRKQVAIFLGEQSARYRGVTIPEDDRGAQLALLVRGGCTLAPDAYLFTVIDRAILAEKDKLPKRQ
jgi:hypothetical protein